MIDYEKIADRFWNLEHKGKEEQLRETYFIDDIIQKAHIAKEIENNLTGVSTILDAGAGAGRFSIPLSIRGYKVTHYDISESMIFAAKRNEDKLNATKNMTFIKGKLSELKRFSDNSFDLVTCFDAPISYCYPNQNDIIGEIVRIAKKAIVISVSCRYGYAPYVLNPFQKLQFILDENADNDTVQWYIKDSKRSIDEWIPDWQKLKHIMTKGLEKSPEKSYEEIERGNIPWPINYLFTPEELNNILNTYDLAGIKLSGPGAFARTLPSKILRKLMKSEDLRGKFLDFCYEFDSLQSVLGLAKDNLVASAQKK